MLLPFLKPILWAIIFSLVLYPVHLRLSRRIGNGISALMLTLLVLALVVLPFSLVLFMAIRQLVELLHLLAGLMQNNSYQDLIKSITEHPIFKRFVTTQELQNFLNYISSEEFRSMLLSGLRDLLQKALNLLASTVPAVGAFLFKTFVFLLTLFFILRDGPKFVRFAERFLPMHREDIQQVFFTIYRTVLATVYGSIGVAVAQSFVGFVGYKLVGLDYAVLLAMATFISSFIPPFGAGFVWFPVAVYTFATKGTYAGAFMFLYGLLLISTIDNFVRPLVMKMGISIPYIVLFFSILGGLLTFGFVGIFLGPIIFTTLFTLALIYEKRVLGRESLTQDHAS